MAGRYLEKIKLTKLLLPKKWSPVGAAENYSHEANGHALLYILSGGDHKDGSHQSVNG